MTKLDLHYVDHHLVELYDIENPRGADTDFYVRLAADLDASSPANKTIAATIIDWRRQRFSARRLPIKARPIEPISLPHI